MVDFKFLLILSMSWAYSDSRDWADMSGKLWYLFINFSKNAIFITKMDSTEVERSEREVVFFGTLL